MSDPSPQDVTDALLDAALPHVAFDGWSDKTFGQAVAESGVAPALARAICPRGGLDLAVAHHRRGDRAMRARLAEADLTDMRFRDRIAFAVRLRIEASGSREAVRRATALFALPQHGPEGGRLIWDTADAIWTALGDRSDDVNWYTKRATLSGVYASTVLYWLGDDSEGHADTWAFLDRRIGDVMRIEKAKAHIRENRALSRLFAGPAWVLGRVRAPARMPDMPGNWTGPR